MSRSGYIDDPEGLELWRGSVARAIRGKRGQRALLDLIAALDAMDEKKLIGSSFSTECGMCTLGVLAASRGVDVSDLEPKVFDGEVEPVDRLVAGKRLDIAQSMVAEVMYMNDEAAFLAESDEDRWVRMRRWVVGQLSPENALTGQSAEGK